MFLNKSSITPHVTYRLCYRSDQVTLLFNNLLLIAHFLTQLLTARFPSYTFATWPLSEVFHQLGNRPAQKIHGSGTKIAGHSCLVRTLDCWRGFVIDFDPPSHHFLRFSPDPPQIRTSSFTESFDEVLFIRYAKNSHQVRQ